MIDFSGNPELIQQISTYGYFALVPLLVFEGPATAFVGGFLSALGVFNVFVVIALFTILRCITDTLFFFTARSGTSALEKLPYFGKRLKSQIDEIVQTDSVETGEQFFREHFLKLFVAAKVIPVPNVATTAAITAGISRISRRRFFEALFIAQPIWSVMIVSFGYYVGSFSGQIQLQDIAVPALSVLSVGFLWWLYKKQIRNILFEKTPLKKYYFDK